MEEYFSQWVHRSHEVCVGVMILGTAAWLAVMAVREYGKGRRPKDGA